MRICLISREYPPETGWGGIGAYTYQHAQALLEAGHDVEIISICKKDSTVDMAPQGAPTDTSTIRVHRAAWGALLDELDGLRVSLPHTQFLLKAALALWRKFLEVHSQRPFDVIEAPEHLAEAIFPALTHICPLVLRLHTPHSKFVREGYSNINVNFDQRFVCIIERLAMLEADLLSSPSVDLASYVAADTGIDVSKIQIVRNPVDTNRFTPEGEIALVNPDKATVFFAGRLEERKGIHYLIDAVPEILADCPNVSFIVLGADSNTAAGNTSVLSDLKNRLEQSGSLTSVSFVSHVPLTEMPSYYRSADICVVPSLYENAPYTVLEALATGKPVIGSSAGGTPEYIADGETGLVVPAKDSKALARAIIALVSDKNKRQAMGKKAREHAVKLYRKEVIAAEAVASYELAISKHNSAPSTAIYKKSADQSLTDFVQLLFSYNENLNDFLYLNSRSYKLKYWQRYLVQHPDLFFAKLKAILLRRLPGANSNKAIQSELAKIREKTTAFEKNREELAVKALLKACQLDRLEILVPSGSKGAPGNSLQPGKLI